MLTAPGCLQLHRALLLDTLDFTASLPVSRRLFLADCSARELGLFEQELVSSGISLQGLELKRQRGAELGSRLRNAYLELAEAHTRVVFLGADSPTLPLEWLQLAFEVLSHHSFVIGPTRDGGYYCLGIREDRPVLFQGIDWGTAKVFQQTTRQLRPGEFQLLPAWYDVDVPADLQRLRRDLDAWPQGRPGRPQRTSSFLDACAFLSS